MSFRDELARVIANDPRYSIEAYAFILEALNQARQLKLKTLARDRPASETKKSSDQTRPTAEAAGKPRVAGHVNGSELCSAVRKLALRQYGMLGGTVLAHWGVRSTADIGEIVYDLIAAGDLEKTPNDSRSDFDNVFDFNAVFIPVSSSAADSRASKSTEGTADRGSRT